MFNPATGKEEHKQLHDLSVFNEDSDHYDADAIAEADKRKWRIESIISHTGNTRLKASLFFRVRWDGDVSPKETVEPWRNVYETEQLHSYLSSKGLKYLIPRKFK